MDNELTPRSDEFGLAKADQSKAPITNHESASFGKQLLGFWVTFRTMFKKVNTVQYPEVKEPTAERFHGRHQLNRHPDGLEKCIGCELPETLAPLAVLFAVKACVVIVSAIRLVIPIHVANESVDITTLAIGLAICVSVN